MNFSLYTLVQNLTFSKKSNNSMKNGSRVTNNMPQIIDVFLFYLPVTLALKFCYRSNLRITKN